METGREVRTSGSQLDIFAHPKDLLDKHPDCEAIMVIDCAGGRKYMPWRGHLCVSIGDELYELTNAVWERGDFKNEWGKRVFLHYHRGM